MRDTPPSPSRANRLVVLLGRALVVASLFGLTTWGVMAIGYSDLPQSIRPIAAVCYAAVVVVTLQFVRPRWLGVVATLVVWALLVAWWLSIPPSNDRDWQPNVAVLPWATIDGDSIVIHNIRNCEYRTETDYTVRNYDKTLQLDHLRTIDLFLVYWGSPSIAHTMLSFGFDDGGYVCISVETRTETGEGYSPIKGCFRQFELIYVVADERDVIRLRTNYRHEDVYLYRLKVQPQVARDVFLDYLHEINQLKLRPQWYNALTDNCTTNIRGHTAPYNPGSTWDWRVLINGYVDEMAYERGRLDQSLPFPELKRRSHVNEAANELGPEADFSKAIRRGRPGFER